MKQLGILSIFLILNFPVFCATNNNSSIRFYNQGLDQRDRVRIQIDDDITSTVDNSSAADIGAGNFSIDFWLRGTLVENSTTSRTAGEHDDNNWRLGNILFDRDIWSLSNFRDFGISVRGGKIEWGTDTGGVDANGHTLVGSINVLDNQWHHIAVTRNSVTGVKQIYIDNTLDQESSTGVSAADLSYPNDGVGDQVAPCGNGPWGPYITIGKEKHDTDWAIGGCATTPTLYSNPGYQGWIDEVRLWNIALDAATLSEVYRKVTDPVDYPSMAAYWRFEEATGTVIGDSSNGGTIGVLFDGTTGNGEWSLNTPHLPGYPLPEPSVSKTWDLYN